ncbi:hypothetical protein Tsubulata_034330 [Turnera subulata]|uniref:CCHC-type domain-containing protein n=1 Tax=Turnera subulata TaxID=218843 RepID=A0A9Q0JKN1_9ROSI|nr:hypothetical protein Tsubulata_034330 [Turnera subulata]
MTDKPPDGGGSRPAIGVTPAESGDERMELGEPSVDAAAASPKSFRDVLGTKPMASPLEIDTELEALEGDVVSEMTERGPVIRLSDRFRDRINKQWEDTVIVKIWGHTLGYRMLCNRLQRLWSLRGGFRVIDLDHNYYLVKLTDHQDYLHVLTGGPWVILDHYLTVESWQPNFDLSRHKVTSIVAWVRVPGLSTELYQLAILKEICNRIGRMIRVDYSTQKTERGRFAKVVVELDISKPLETEACVDGVWYPIVYESLPQVCFNCGRAGHLMVNCPIVVFPTPSVSATTPHQPMPVSSSGGMESVSTTMKPGLAIAGVSSTKYGDWMLVPPRNRQHRKKTSVESQDGRKDTNKGKQPGSRFVALEEAVDVEEFGPASVKLKTAPISLSNAQGSKNVSTSKHVPQAGVHGKTMGKSVFGDAQGIYSGRITGGE